MRFEFPFLWMPKMLSHFKQFKAVVFTVVVILFGEVAANESQPCWIWGASHETKDSVRFERKFQTKSPTTARIALTNKSVVPVVCSAAPSGIMAPSNTTTGHSTPS